MSSPVHNQKKNERRENTDIYGRDIVLVFMLYSPLLIVHIYVANHDRLATINHDLVLTI